jgi:hypothetical protein
MSNYNESVEDRILAPLTGSSRPCYESFCDVLSI